MSRRSQQKRQARAKEKAKAARRRRNASPISLLAAESTIRAYRMSSDVETGLESFTVTRERVDGPLVLATFLIDYPCLGLKDAFCRFDLRREEFDFMRKQHLEQFGRPIEVIAPATLRQSIASAIRWTQQNDFRLPPQTQRCLAILGGEIDAANADTSEFGEDGNLHYIGRKSDLERALTVPLEEFLDREDVDVTFMAGLEDDDAEPLGEFDDADEFDEDDLDDDEDFDEEADGPLTVEEMRDAQETIQEIEMISEGILAEVVAWCHASGREPHPMLPMMIRLGLTDHMMTEYAKETREEASAVMEQLDEVFGELSEDQKEGLAQAAVQLRHFHLAKNAGSGQKDA